MGLSRVPWPRGSLRVDEPGVSEGPEVVDHVLISLWENYINTYTSESTRPGSCIVSGAFVTMDLKISGSA